MAVLDWVARFGLTDKCPEGMKVIRVVTWLPGEKYSRHNSQCKGPVAGVTQEVLGTARRPEWLEWRKQKRVL